MTDWTAGYVADIGYTFGYYAELNPLKVQLAFLQAGLVCPAFGTACELGFGQGVSTNIHAAATITQWSGTDFNPSQAGFAQELSVVSDNGARLFDQAFDEFAARDDLPEFDYIGLHGIWSWISNANRAVIVDFIRRKLKVGGVLYISYNTQPGWAAMVPMRDLLTEHAEVMGATGHGIVPRINASLDFVTELLATKPAYAQVNPQIAERVSKIKEQDRNYVAHEYFNRDWLPMSFADMARWLEPAKLGFACSANYLDAVEAINLSTEQTAFLAKVPDAMFRQTVRDFMVNTQFRKDYWVKGARKLTPLSQIEHMRSQRVLLTSHRADVPLTVRGAVGEAKLQAAVYDPILDLLADHKPRTLHQIELAVKDKDIKYAQVVQAVMILTGSGHLQTVQDDAVASKARKLTDKLNTHLMQQARSSGEIGYLASPVTGGGIATPRFVQLYILAMQGGKKQPAEWAQFAWQTISVQGQRLVKEGKAVESAEENLAEITRQAQVFADKLLPVMRALHIV